MVDAKPFDIVSKSAFGPAAVFQIPYPRPDFIEALSD